MDTSNNTTAQGDVIQKREQLAMDVGCPADFSFKCIEGLDFFEKLSAEELEAMKPRGFRVGGMPKRNKNNRYLTKSIWLNNNRIQTVEKLDMFLARLVVYPEHISWLDFSYNKITDIDEGLLKFNNLKILYFHGNNIQSFKVIMKLKPMGNLRSVTFHGNPVENTDKYRSFVINLLPQIKNLDFITITRAEKTSPCPPGFKKLIT